LPRRGVSLDEEESHVLRTYRGTWMSLGHRHAGCTSAAIGGYLKDSTGCNREVRVIDILA
jgi:hypothetical protein